MAGANAKFQNSLKWPCGAAKLDSKLNLGQQTEL